MKLGKHYNPKLVEEKWRKYWEKENIYKFDPKSKKPIFSIDVPPPYASAGHLHMGHALHYTQFEIIARQRRMAGYNVYFPPCFDNNGLPTEKYVEEKFNISKSDTTKAEFRKLCLKESAKVEKSYADNVFKRLGHSYDWSLLYTTIDPEAQKVAQKSFLDLIKTKNCYRAEEPTLWCIYHQTALAQAEVEDLKRTTKINNILFDIKGEKEQLKIGTTRPELLAACVGIFVNPEDKRYKRLVGKTAIVPLFHHEVKIMEEERVDKDFSTGAVFIATFGDSSDIEWWKKHKLPLRIALNKDGTLNKLAKKYKGLNLKEAKEAVLGDLKEEKRLVKQEDLKQTVGTCWRCNTPIEFIVTEQWFIKTLKYKKELIKKGREINWYPEFFRKRYEDWTNNLAWDWCISRQRFYGVPIPVWYCKDCANVNLPEENDLPLDPEQTKPKKKCKCGSNKFEPDHDVFDTWMTSSMSPEIAIRWLEKPKQFKKMFPTSIRVQSSEIIRTWAFYTILKSYLHFNSIPWKDIAIGTFVLDDKGHGMSKSKGNVVWADEMLKKYDIDTFRYWVGTARWGTDLPFKEQELVAGKRFITKLWNAARFAINNLKDYNFKKPKKLEIMDKWILTKLNSLVLEVNKSFDTYSTGDAKRVTENFFWHTFADHYIEIIKDRLYNPDKRGNKTRLSAQYTLYNTFLTIVKLFAPIMPFITEEIYQDYFKKFEKEKSIHISKWPKYDKKLEDKKLRETGELFISILSNVRQFKTKNKKSLKEPVKLTLNKKDKLKLKNTLEDLKAVTNATEIKFGSKFKVEF